MYRLKRKKTGKVFLILLLALLFSCLGRQNCLAAQTHCEASSDSLSDALGGTLSDYDFKEIDQAVDEINESGYGVSFQKVVSEIISGGETDGKKGIFSAISNVLLGTVKSNRTAVIQIIMLAVLSAGIKCFAPAFNKNQVTDTAQLVIQLSLITILLASFYVACGICADAVSGCVNIYKALIPVFFSAVSFASGSATAGVYYELVLMMITVVSSLFGTVLITLDKVYVLFAMADSVSGEERFSKASELIPNLIKWTCRAAILIFTGLGGIKSLINPMSDSLKKNMLYKTLQMLPGIGGSVETVSQTVIGAGTIIKNGIGTAAIVVLVIVCSVPVLKLAALTLLFKVTAAAIEPVSDKRIVKAVNGISVAIGSLSVIVLVTVSLFILMAALICISTNYNYLA